MLYNFFGNNFEALWHINYGVRRLPWQLRESISQDKKSSDKKKSYSFLLPQHYRINELHYYRIFYTTLCYNNAHEFFWRIPSSMIIFSKQLYSTKTSIFIIIRTNGYSHCYAFLQNLYCYMAYKQKKKKKKDYYIIIFSYHIIYILSWVCQSV